MAHSSDDDFDVNTLLTRTQEPANSDSSGSQLPDWLTASSVRGTRYDTLPEGRGKSDIAFLSTQPAVADRAPIVLTSSDDEDADDDDDAHPVKRQKVDEENVRGQLVLAAIFRH
jgi:hypothetical protein